MEISSAKFYYFSGTVLLSLLSVVVFEPVDEIFIIIN